MAGPTRTPELVEGRAGLGGFAGLYVEALRLLRSSGHLRISYAWWLGVGFVVTEAFSVGVGQLQSGRAAELAALAGLGWWALVSLVLVGGASLLIDSTDGRRIDFVGTPNGLTGLRAYSCLPLLLCATLSTPHRLGFILWATLGAGAGMLDAVDGYIARRVGPATQLGRALDPAMDALFFSMAAVGNRALGIVPTWLMALMLLRYLGPLLATPVVLLSRRRPELVHTTWGRRNTLLIGFVLFVLLLVRSVDGPVDAVALALGIPLIATTTVLHFLALAQRTYYAPRVRERGGLEGPRA